MSKKLDASGKIMSAFNRKMKAVCKAAVREGNPVQFADSIVQQLDVLSVRRKEWEANDYKKANEGLYALLANCLSVFQARFMNGTKEEQAELRGCLIERLQADGIRVVKTSTTLTMLARYVFNSDRKRAQGYGSVLAAAISHEIQANDFAAWVIEQGGIEEIKRKMVKSESAQTLQKSITAATVGVKEKLELNEHHPLAHIDINGLTGGYALLLAKPNANGGADIVGTLNDINDAMLNALILRMAKQLVIEKNANDELGLQVEKEQFDLLAVPNYEQQRKVA